MAVVTTRAIAATVNALITRVRTMVGDPASLTATPRWSNQQIQDAIDAMMMQMYNELTANDVSSFLLNLSMTYTGAAVNTAIPAGIEGNSITRVEDTDDPNNPVYLDWMDTIDPERFNTRRGWTLMGGNIAIRPIPSTNKSLRIWYVGNFFPIGTSLSPATDQHAMAVNHEELIYVGAAIRLQEVDDEVPGGRYQRYQQLWEQFKTVADRFRGPVYVRATRSYR